MQLNTQSAALSVFQMMFADGKVRAHPVMSDTMEPTFYKGEFVGVVPCDRYEGEAIYLLHDPFEASIWRCQYRADLKLIRCWQDNQAYGQTLELTVDDFAEAVLGKVVALCGHPDRPRGHVQPRTF